MAPRLPRIVRYLALHCVFGLLAGCLFSTLLIVTNVGGLKDLLNASEHPYLPALMLYVGCALTFASLVMGTAVMTLGEDRDRDKD